MPPLNKENWKKNLRKKYGGYLECEFEIENREDINLGDEIISDITKLLAAHEDRVRREDIYILKKYLQSRLLPIDIRIDLEKVAREIEGSGKVV